MTSIPTDSLDLPTLQTKFRNVMAAVCTPVAVVTATSDDLPYGTTVSAFTSLSMTPPMVLVSLDTGSELLAVVQKTGTFGLNVLGSAQSDLALTFARKGGPAKFSGVAWENESGVPRLPGASGFLACSVEQMVEGGDHLVVLGGVRTAHLLDSPPLTYHDRVFGTHVALGDG
ncbi:flavin reductase family protein [Rhodococcus sp. NPDC056960]|uniref:flavin reductase family protein n=1 Tax=Rhodococcus sp. NPDC056960 TaxID=3345982 RepID=UPI00362CB832